jgi:hypothetical protein
MKGLTSLQLKERSLAPMQAKGNHNKINKAVNGNVLGKNVMVITLGYE